MFSQDFSDNNQSKNQIPNFLNPLIFLATDEVAAGVRYQEAGIFFANPIALAPRLSDPGSS
jgi:hypothetical protein